MVALRGLWRAAAQRGRDVWHWRGGSRLLVLLLAGLTLLLLLFVLLFQRVLKIMPNWTGYVSTSS